MVNPDPQHIFFSPASSYRSRLPSATNNNKTVRSSPFHLQYSRKRTGNTLPPLLPGQQRPRQSRVRTVPSSRQNSSKLSRLDSLELDQTATSPAAQPSKRSRSASEDAINYLSLSPDPVTNLNPPTNNNLEPGREAGRGKTGGQADILARPRRLTKVETVRVLRARSALLLPLPPPALPAPMTVTPFVLKSEDRKKKRR